MVELLSVEKRHLIAEHGHVTHRDFRDAWDRSWTQMVIERAFPHATVHRRNWRRALVGTQPEFRAAFLDEPSAFSFAAARLSEAAEGMCLHLEPAQLGTAILAAVGYVEGPEDVAAAVRASDAARAFVECAAA